MSKHSTLLNSELKIDELYDISIPEMKININDFLLCLNDCFLYFSKHKKIALQVHIKIGEYEIIDNKKYKIVALEFISDEKIEIESILEQKAQKANANLFYSSNKLQLELPMIQ